MSLFNTAPYLKQSTAGFYLINRDDILRKRHLAF